MKTIAFSSTYTYEILSSKFIAVVFPLNNSSEFKPILDSVKKEYKKATHYVYAYKVGGYSKSSDDKEPSGTAGHPILELFEKRELDNIGAIVVRYFGGSKLGAGRLLRSYVTCVNQALNNAELKEI